MGLRSLAKVCCMFVRTHKDIVMVGLVKFATVKKEGEGDLKDFFLIVGETMC
jgi:hypothetical protein